ncbi:MAG: hypothetical protein WCA04_15695 [Geobacteraceae bacterium]
MKRTFTILGVLALLQLPVVAMPAEKVLKDLEEYTAYTGAQNVVDPQKKAEALEAFVEHYPKSILRINALEQAMAGYQKARNLDKTVETANAILKLQPDNLRVLVLVAFLQRVKATQGDKAALEQSRISGEEGLVRLSNWTRPDGVTEIEFGRMRTNMKAIFSGAVAFAALQNKDYAKARKYYLEAVRPGVINVQDIFQLSIAELEMNPLDTNGFWHVAKTADMLKSTNAAAAESFVEYGKAKYLNYHGTDEGWAELLAAVHNQRTLPAAFSVTPAPPMVIRPGSKVKNRDQ